MKLANTEKQVVINIQNHMNKEGGTPFEWYVGITNNPEDALFSRHNVSRLSGKWIYDACFNNQSARNVESYFINTIKTDGGPGGGDTYSLYVYAYRKTTSTSQD
jgi:hypothetical protein